MITHLVLDGVADGPLGVGLDVVGAASRLVEAGLGSLPGGTATLRQRVVSLDGKPVCSGAGRPVAVDGSLCPQSLKACDVLVLPGLSAATEGAIEGLLAREDAVRCTEAVAEAATRGATVAASCSATFVVAASGVLKGRSATTNWWLVPAFIRHFPDIRVRVDRMVVESEGVWTAGSAFAHADLMLALLARIASPSIAHLAARYLVLDERVSQARYMVTEHLHTADPGLRAVEAFVMANLCRQVSLGELARAAGMSPRTLARRVQAGLGLTPLQYVQRVRMAHAAHLLETTGETVEAVAARVGYADAAAFRRVFRRHTGESPRWGADPARSRSAASEVAQGTDMPPQDAT